MRSANACSATLLNSHMQRGIQQWRIPGVADWATLRGREGRRAEGAPQPALMPAGRRLLALFSGFSDSAPSSCFSMRIHFSTYLTLLQLFSAAIGRFFASSAASRRALGNGMLAQGGGGERTWHHYVLASLLQAWERHHLVTAGVRVTAGGAGRNLRRRREAWRGVTGRMLILLSVLRFSAKQAEPLSPCAGACLPWWLLNCFLFTFCRWLSPLASLL